eukprot:GCRY01005123.1.p1 GENE.GCRY01005123.1~~GCRY01005123.1.p1  ORF type:complete len:267 (+),score=31.80 GCRY01005123.1:223-1023(+)
MEDTETNEQEEINELLSDLSFYDYVDSDLAFCENIQKEEVIARIEVLTFDLLHTLVHKNKISPLTMLRQKTSNSVMKRNAVRLKQGTKTKLWRRSPQSYEKVWLVLNRVYEILKSGVTVTQRELYYMLVGHFSSQTHLNETVREVTSLLRVPRPALGITTSIRGRISGLLCLDHTDCRNAGVSGHPIVGNTALITQMKLSLPTVGPPARYCLIVEKEAIFQRLVEQRVWESVPGVVLTACGMPDLATRCVGSENTNFEDKKIAQCY